MKCKICGKEFHGWGNKAFGLSVLVESKEVKFNAIDVCCDECYKKHIIPIIKNKQNKGE